VILVLKHGIHLDTEDIVVLSFGLPFSVLWMFLGRAVVNIIVQLFIVFSDVLK